MANSIILISIVNIINQILGFFRDTLVAFYYGASYISDAYVVSVIIPSVIIGIIASGINSVFVPEYVKLENKFADEKMKYTIVMIVSSLILGIIFAICVWLLKDYMFVVFANGFNDEAKSLASEFINLTILSMPLILMNNIMAGYFQVSNRQLFSALIIIPSNLIGISVVYLSYLYGNIYLLPLCYLMTLFTTFLLHSLISGFSYVEYFKINTLELKKYSKKTYKLAFPVMLGVSANQINFIIDRSLSTTVYEGALSIVNIAVRISSIVEVVFITSIMLVYYPILSRVRKNETAISYCVLELFFIAVMVVFPVVFIFYFYSVNIVDLLFGHGSFTKNNVIASAELLSIYSLSIPFVYIKVMFSKLMYSKGETKVPTIIVLVGVFINITFNIFLVKIIGLKGLAISTFISNLCTAGLALRYLKIENYYNKDFKSLSTLLVPCLLYFYICYLMKEYISYSIYIFVMAVSLGLIIYVLMTWYITKYICKKKNIFCKFNIINKKII